MSRTWLFLGGSTLMFADMHPAQVSPVLKRSRQFKWFLITLCVAFAGIALAGDAFGQSLADLAQEARERTAREGASAQVYTNDDLAPPAQPAPSAASPARVAKVKAEEQDRPLTINGTFSSGFYNSYTRGGGNGNQSLEFVPAGATFDINGYYLTPDLLDYWVQPELHYGPQASDAGFQGGNGVRMRISMLRRRAFPVTFRYSNVQLEDVFFGSLSQLSSYTLKNRNKDLGLTSEFKRAGLPKATLDWGFSSVDSKPGIAMIPDYLSHSKHLNLDSQYERWGWDFQGFAHRQQQTSNLLTFLGDGASSSSLEQKIMQVQGSARRGFLQDSELYMDAGSQSTANLMFNQPIDLTTRYASANLRLLQRRKWRTSLRAGYTSNIAGLLLTRLVGGLGGNGAIAPDASVLQPFQHTISNLNLNALTSVDLAHGLGFYGSADRTAVIVAGDSGLRSSYFTTAGGMTYAGRFRWGNLSGQYGREFGIGSVTGQSGRIQGQNYVATVQHGNPDGLQFDLSIHGTDQSVHNAQPANNHSFASDGSAARRLFGQFSARLGGGWQQGTFTNADNEFHSRGYTAHASIEHPRLQLSGSLNTSLGNSLQAYSQMYGGIGAEAALLTPLHLIPSDLRGMTLTLHSNPTRKMELSALWTHSIQHLEGVVANDFQILDVHATYSFRRLHLEFGFFRSYQIFSSYLAIYPETERGRFYFRVVRTFKVL